MENDSGFTGGAIYAGGCLLTSGMIFTALDGVVDKGYKSGYVKMVGPGLVFICLRLLMIRIVYISIKGKPLFKYN